MADAVIRQATVADAPAMARLIARVNADPESRCVQSATGETAEEIGAELRRGLGESRLLARLAERDGAAIGVLCCDVDPAVGRGWLRGPLIEGEPWRAVAGPLFEALRGDLPPSVTRLDTYLDPANERGLRFYDRLGFRRIRTVHVFAMDRPREPIPVAGRIHTLREEETTGFAALHESLFAEGGVPGRVIAARIDAEHRVFVLAEGGRVLGYVDVSAERDASEGWVDHLGVDPSAQGRGFGAQLLRAALRWCFEERGMPRVGLAMDEELENARRLYERVGFRLEQSGVNQRWEGGAQT